MVEGQIFLIEYATGGSSGMQTQFPYPYYLWEFSDLIVQWTDLQAHTTTLVQDTDYTLSGTADDFGSYPDGVTVTTIGANSPRPNGSLLITRSTAHTQMNTWIDNSPFPADQEEHSFDKLTLMIQEMAKGFLGVLNGPPPSGTPPIPVGAWFIQYPLVPGTFFGWCMTTGGWKQFAPISF
jgi:hypothetical protein